MWILVCLLIVWCIGWMIFHPITTAKHTFVVVGYFAVGLAFITTIVYLIASVV